MFEELFALIQQTIEAFAEMRKRTQVINWLRDFCKYLAHEPRFNAKSLKKYYPGDILDVNFGYNIGAELSGPHFAVVVEDNARSDGTIVIVPLSSYNIKAAKIHSSEVDLGILPQLNEYRKTKEVKGSKARVSHIRSISKMRIYYPKKTADSLGRLTNEQLQSIYDALRNRYCSQFAKEEIKKETEQQQP